MSDNLLNDSVKVSATELSGVLLVTREPGALKIIKENGQIIEAFIESRSDLESELVMRIVGVNGKATTLSLSKGAALSVEAYAKKVMDKLELEAIPSKKNTINSDFPYFPGDRGPRMRDLPTDSEDGRSSQRYNPALPGADSSVLIPGDELQPALYGLGQKDSSISDEDPFGDIGLKLTPLEEAPVNIDKRMPFTRNFTLFFVATLLLVFLGVIVATHQMHVAKQSDALLASSQSKSSVHKMTPNTKNADFSDTDQKTLFSLTADEIKKVGYDLYGIPDVLSRNVWVLTGGKIPLPLPGGGTLTDPKQLNDFGAKP
jgi:hypothetical protein